MAVHSPVLRPLLFYRYKKVENHRVEDYIFSAGDAGGQSRSQLSEGSVTLKAEELEAISQVDEKNVTITIQKGRTEVF